MFKIKIEIMMNVYKKACKNKVIFGILVHVLVEMALLVVQ